MEISKGRMFRTLFKKDMLIGKNESLLILGFIIVANLFLFYKAETNWTPQTVLGLSVALLTFIPLITFFKAFSSISGEWKENTVYLMMSLPVTGNMIFLSKLLVLLTQTVILTLVALPFTGILFFKYMLNISDLGSVLSNLNTEMIGVMLQVFIMATTGFALALVTAFLSTLVGRMFKKFSGLISFIVFIAINLLIGAISEVLPLENVQHGLISATDFMINEAFLLVTTVIVFICTTMIYDRKIEL